MRDDIETIEPTDIIEPERQSRAVGPVITPNSVRTSSPSTNALGPVRRTDDENKTAPTLEMSEAEADDLADMVQNDKAASTTRAYLTQQGLYEMWARANGVVPSWPANPANILIWLKRRAEGEITQAWETTDPDEVGQKVRYVNAKGETVEAKLKLVKKQKIPSIMTALAAIKTYHKDNGYKFDAEHPGLVRGIKSLRRKHVEGQRQMKAKDIDKILVSFAEKERTDRTKGKKPCARDIRDAAMMSMLYVFAMRRSELERLDYAELGEGDGVLRIDHAQAERVLYGSKTKQDDTTTIFVAREHNPRMFAALDRWIDFAGIEPGTPLMRSITPKRTVSKKRLSGDGIHHALRAAIVRYYVGKGTDRATADAIAKQFGGHSGRVGFVVAAKEAGASNGQIQARTGQASDSTTNRYGKSADQLKNAADKLEGVGL